jgi:hypothetical protein
MFAFCSSHVKPISSSVFAVAQARLAQNCRSQAVRCTQKMGAMPGFDLAA